MRMPTALRNLDDRVLGRKDKGSQQAASDGDVYPEDRDGDTRESRPARSERGESPPRRPAGDVGREVLSTVWRVARIVFLLLALVTFLGIVLTFAPTNDDNRIVSAMLSWAETVAGPFRDVFTAEDPRRALLYNYALATAVYLLAASLVTKLPGRRGTRG
jgi:hypothetical protein